MTDRKNAPPRFRLGALIGEILPLAIFFGAYQFFGIFIAAASAVGASALAILAFWLIEKRLARFALFTSCVSAAITLAAILTESSVLIKIQPSIFSGCFAAVLLGGLLFGKAMMREFFGAQFALTDRTWVLLSLRWGLFFAVATLANEWAWRVLDEADWVRFRVFVIAPATALFMLAQLPLSLRGRLPPPHNDAA